MRYLGRAEAAGQTEPGRARRVPAADAARRLPGGRAAVGHVGLAAVGAQVGDRVGQAVAAEPPSDAAAGASTPRSSRRSPRPAAPSSARFSPRSPPAGSVAASPTPCSASPRSCRSSISTAATTRSARRFLASVFVAGGVTAAFYGWFPLYFPEIFPTSIRATSQGFAYNFGRVLSAIGSLQTAVLIAYFSQGLAENRKAVDGMASAGATLAAIYLIGVVLIWFGPETRGQPLPD